MIGTCYGICVPLRIIGILMIRIFLAKASVIVAEMPG